MNAPTHSSDNDGLPLGFGVALAKNEKALETFSMMTEKEKRMVLFDVRHVKNQSEMKALVDRLGGIG